MSQTATATSAAGYKDLDPWDGISYAVIECLAPLFITSICGPAYARRAAFEAITAYKPQSRADYGNIGRIVAFSLLVMAIAAKAAAADVPLELQLKILSRLQAVSRTADATEKVMVARRNQAWADGSYKRPDTLIGRPPTEEYPYPPLPDSDRASAAYASQMAERTDVRAEMPPAALRQAAPQSPANAPAARPRTTETRASAEPRPDTFEAFVRDTIASSGDSFPDIDTLLNQFGLPPLDSIGPHSPTVKMKDGSAAS